jgi:RHS repeat-associated protein
MAANSLTGYSASAGFGGRSAENEAYDARYSYDPNGNLLTLQRYDKDGSISHDYNYTYFAGTNRLQKVLDEYIPPVPESKTYNTNPLVPDGEKYKHITLDSGAVVTAGSTVDLEATQRIVLKPGTVIEPGATFTASLASPDTIVIPPEGQYLYDEIGNLVRDNAEKVTIAWTPYGKVRNVTKDNGDITAFQYDAAGNRIEKKVLTANTTLTTHYIRDASGNVMATYTNTELKEQPIYGSSRLGMYRGGTEPGQEQLGNKYYELTNHLGNVLAVVTDNINIDDTEVTASVASVSDYYPFGLGMEGRTYSSDMYRYGFNGKEKDNEGLGGGGSTYDYGFRIYNPSIAKFLSVDPLSKSYPWYTPYQFAGNKPIWAVDLDGLEELKAIDGKIIAVGPYSEETRIKILMSYLIRKANSLSMGIDPDSNLSDEVAVVRQKDKLQIYGEKNMLGAYTRTTVRTEGRTAKPEWVTDYSAKILHKVAQESGDTDIKVTSAYRTPYEQARIMFDNIERRGAQYNYRLYQWPGDRVIDTYSNWNSDWNCTNSECIDRMRQTLIEVGPSNVSKHASDPDQYNTLDIAPSSIDDNAEFKEVLKKYSQNYSGAPDALIEKYVPPPADPAHHIEIPQNSQL